MDITKTALMRYLYKKDVEYYGAVLKLKGRIEKWLSYVPQTFPQYTSHTIGHSEEIILQISKLLFKDNNPNKNILDLSSIEIYILLVASYLHDAGMVTSEKEKNSILRSEKWNQFISKGEAGEKRWSLIQDFIQNPPKDLDKQQVNFLSNVQIRYLLSDFIRRTHHLKVIDVIDQFEPQLAGFGFDNPLLVRTIKDVCVSHGLKPFELANDEKFPERRDIRGETVNVRFLTILLRLGDLLDLDFDRACPLLLNAACPLPSDSLARWSKYQRITQRLTAPDRIEIKAECNTLEEHRYLKDWCIWIVEELKEARTLMSSSLRHNWVLPTASIGEYNSTIVIKPSDDAKYIPVEWKFELDNEIIFKRLIKDLYEYEFSFIRELVQNSLDATRCKILLDIKDKLDKPKSTMYIEENIRKKYPISINLDEKLFYNEISQEEESRQVIEIEDMGIGMDLDIIQNYLLQIGRSYYLTDEFKSNFSFEPSSRFGLGFLSIFAECENVVVETYKPTSAKRDGSIKLVLTGPRNYITVEKGNRFNSGTKITAILKNKLDKNKLRNSICKWCKRVEFPININLLGEKITLQSEKSDDFVYSMPDVTESQAIMGVKAYPLSEDGIDGEIYVFYWLKNGSERWDLWKWASEKYPESHPNAIYQKLPYDLICINGINVYSRYNEGKNYEAPYNNFTYRINLYKNIFDFPIDRRISMDSSIIKIPLKKIGELIKHHIESEKRLDDWKYKNRLINDYPDFSFWIDMLKMVPTYNKNCLIFKSYKDIMDDEKFALVYDFNGYYSKERINKNIKYDYLENVLLLSECINVNWHIREYLFNNFHATSIIWTDENYFIINYENKKMDNSELKSIEHLLKNNLDFVDLKRKDVFGINNRILGKRILNLTNDIIKWFLKIINLNDREIVTIDNYIIEKTAKLIMGSVEYPILHKEALCKYLKQWGESKIVNEEFLPPLVDDVFVFEIQT